MTPDYHMTKLATIINLEVTLTWWREGTPSTDHSVPS